MTYAELVHRLEQAIDIYHTTTGKYPTQLVVSKSEYALFCADSPIAKGKKGVKAEAKFCGIPLKINESLYTEGKV